MSCPNTIRLYILAQRRQGTLETPLACAWLSQCSSSPCSQPRGPSPAQSSPLQGALACGVSIAMVVPWVVG